MNIYTIVCKKKKQTAIRYTEPGNLLSSSIMVVDLFESLKLTHLLQSYVLIYSSCIQLCCGSLSIRQMNILNIILDIRIIKMTG